jgi:hypothetical protein
MTIENIFPISYNLAGSSMVTKRGQYDSASDYMGTLPGYEPTYTNAPVPNWAPAAGLALGGAAVLGGLAGGRSMLRKFMRGKPIVRPPLNPAAAWESELAARTHSRALPTQTHTPPMVAEPPLDAAKLSSYLPNIILGLGAIARGK